MRTWKYIFGTLVLASIAAWLVVLAPKTEEGTMQLIACDVGQGDAILAIYGDYELLVDGGPDSSVLECLSRHMPFYDRTIEAVVITHPQTDHFAGLIDVFRAYDVTYLVANSLDSGSKAYGVLKNEVGGKTSLIINPTVDTKLELGLMQFDVVWPSSKFLSEEGAPLGQSGLGLYESKRDPNDFSIIGNLRLGGFSALLTGDIGPAVIAQVLSGGQIGHVDYIKVPHHGSKNGLTQDMLTAASPDIAVISVGNGNRFGHPHKEVLDMLTQAGAEIHRTDEEGDVVVETDGQTWWLAR